MTLQSAIISIKQFYKIQNITKKNTNGKAVTLIAIRLLIAGHISEENSEIYQVTQ